MLVAPAPRLVGLHNRDAKASGGSSVTEAVCELLPKVAVTVTVCTLLIVLPAFALKVAAVAPLVTTTENGTVRPALLSLIVTAVLVGAG